MDCKNVRQGILITRAASPSNVTLDDGDSYRQGGDLGAVADLGERTSPSVNTVTDRTDRKEI